MKKRTLTLVIAVMLVAVCAVGGTLAWLMDTTDTVTNTFTVGDINIELDETTGDTYQIIPGTDLDKDPLVTVYANSEACYLFVKVDESNWPTYKDADGTLKVDYSIADGWEALGSSYPGVYYREVSASDANQEFPVLANNKVLVSDELTKVELDEIRKAPTAPTLEFTAYAVQSENIDSAAAAWAKVSN